MTNDTVSLKDKILNDLLKTGFPLEVSTANILNAAGWRVEPSALYIDPDSKVTRELHIHALKVYNKEQNAIDGIAVASHLIIQCKKSNKPWVFFDNAGKSLFWLGFYSLNSPKEDFMSTLCFHGETIGFKYHRYKDVKMHRSFHTALNENGKNKDLYEGLITACKALGYFKNIYSRKTKTAHFFTLLSYWMGLCGVLR